MSVLSPKSNRGRPLGKTVTAWVVLVLILLFALLSIALIALGAQAYRSVHDAGKDHAWLRTSVGYVNNRVKTADGIASMHVETVTLGEETVDVLVFGEEIDGELYQTRLFCAGGALREQFVASGIPLESETDGEVICEMNRFLIIIEDEMITFEMAGPDDEQLSVHTPLRSRREVTL